MFSQSLCSGGGAPSTATLSLAGKHSWDEQLDANNETGSLPTSAGRIVGVSYTGVNFLPIVTDSYCSDVQVYIYASGSQNFVIFSTVEDPPCTDLPKSGFLNWYATFGGGVATSGANTFELCEIFDEAPNAVDANYTAGSLTIYVCPEGQFLPILLTNFYGKTLENANILTWETAEEINVHAQVIERSADGQNWVEIARIEGKESGSGLSKYEIADQNPPVRSFYRLRVVDCDGSATVSKVVFLDRNIDRFEIDGISPNPAQQTASIKFQSQREAEAVLQARDINGKLVFEQKMEATAGENQFTIDVLDWHSGIYLVSVFSGNGFSTPVKFLKG